MSMTAQGLAKLCEEIGELHVELGRLQQVIGKRLAWYDTDEPHWDGQDLRQRLIDELGDVTGAIAFVASRMRMLEEVTARATAKLTLFGEWEEETDNNVHGVDGLLSS